VNDEFIQPTYEELWAASLSGLAWVLEQMRAGLLGSLDWQTTTEPEEIQRRLIAWRNIVNSAPFLRSEDFQAEVGLTPAELKTIFSMMAVLQNKDRLS